MRRNGFSLVEMLYVMGIIGILCAVSVLIYSSMSRKAAIESQVKTMYADLMAARLAALYQKTCRYVTVSATGYSVYTSTVCGAAPPASAAVLTRTLKYPVTNSPAEDLCFDERGVASLTSSDITDTPQLICIQQCEAGVLSSIVVTPTTILIGTQSAGGTCIDPSKITPQ